MGGVNQRPAPSRRAAACAFEGALGTWVVLAWASQQPQEEAVAGDPLAELAQRARGAAVLYHEALRQVRPVEDLKPELRAVLDEDDFEGGDPRSKALQELFASYEKPLSLI
jgi:hypothetical protein